VWDRKLQPRRRAWIEVRESRSIAKKMAIASTPSCRGGEAEQHDAWGIRVEVHMRMSWVLGRGATDSREAQRALQALERVHQRRLRVRRAFATEDRPKKEWVQSPPHDEKMRSRWITLLCLGKVCRGVGALETHGVGQLPSAASTCASTPSAAAQGVCGARASGRDGRRQHRRG
jgi:hypothetical protein